jgi:predicted amidohydrolase
MKISVIGLDSSKFDFSNMASLEEALNDGSDLVVAPEFFLSGLRVVREEEFNERLESLRELSLKYSSLIIPGSMLAQTSNARESYNVVPVFKGGKILGLFYKGSEAGEEKISIDQDLLYIKGDNSKNNFSYDGNNYSIEICRDHGRQIVPINTDIQVIPSYDLSAGFYNPPNFSRNNRVMVLADGQRNLSEACEYSPFGWNKFRKLKGKKTKYGSVFNIK